jgi:hypothetical protein
MFLSYDHLQEEIYLLPTVPVLTVYYCMPLDDGRMTETCCGNKIRGGEEEFLR